MRKTLMLEIAAVAALGFVSCNNNKSTCSNAPAKGGDKEVLYSGVLPSADALGSVYTLKLEFDDDHNYTDGDFTMVETTLAADTVAASGLKDIAASYTKGDFRKETKQVDGTTVEYIRLIPDAKDALGTPSSASMYFVVNADESLTMVSANLQKSENPDLNYTLTMK